LNDQIRQEFKFKNTDPGERYKEMAELTEKVKNVKVSDVGILRILSSLDNFVLFPILSTHIIKYGARCFYLRERDEVK